MTILRFVDDFGSIVIPGYMDHDTYMARYYFYRETL